jgi:hypothetical protein
MSDSVNWVELGVSQLDSPVATLFSCSLLKIYSISDVGERTYRWVTPLGITVCRKLALCKFV